MVNGRAGCEQWEEGFTRLVDYVKGHGDACVPYAYTVDGYKRGVSVGQESTRQTRHP